MNGHDCPRLAACTRHPKWHVYRSSVLPKWYVDTGTRNAAIFPTHAEAVAYATEQARAQQVTAVQDGAQ